MFNRKKKINILCVEDGSVDIDALETEPLVDGKVLVYRQGATKPYILTLEVDKKVYKDMIKTYLKLGKGIRKMEGRK